MGFEKAGAEWKMQLQELENLRLETYDNSRRYKEKMKVVHDKHIKRREFRPGELVLLYNTRLRLMPGKLRSRWEGPYRVEKAEPYEVFHLSHPSSPKFIKSFYIRQKQVPITEEAIQRALDLPPAPEGLDAFQEVTFQRQTYKFDWDTVLRLSTTWQPMVLWIPSFLT
ncbi:uncharacterized protein LOC130975039 [Arachis stenosperma]|uniref:uncharacterized protein LOC130975039 n=1 Tax=Arachis stenosperma TaxID=217475 RepID=UPI0025ACD96B|nr:uncharacterized protein LOC130975039 [Arachis stenosperma]